MTAVVYQGPRDVTVQDVEDPRIDAPTDVIISVTTSAICGSGLHMYEGRTKAVPGIVFGHENMGIVVEVGSGVVSVKRATGCRSRSTSPVGSAATAVMGKPPSASPSVPAWPGAPTAMWRWAPHRGGQANVKAYNTYLRDLVVAGRAKPSFVVSKETPLRQAAEAYARFDRREAGYCKVVLTPATA